MLKNFKLEAKNPNITVSKICWYGDYWVSYACGDKKIFEFYSSSYKRNQAAKNYANEGVSVTIGIRLNDIW